MRTVVYENIYNKEKFICEGNMSKNAKIIDGVEYIRAYRFGTLVSVLIRKDYLRKVSNVE